MNRELKNRFDEYKSDDSKGSLDWEVMGPAINKGLEAKKKKKRRRIFWMTLGMGIGVLISIVSLGIYSFTSTEYKADLASMVSNNTQEVIDISDQTIKNTSDEEKPIANNDKVVNSNSNVTNAPISKLTEDFQSKFSQDIAIQERLPKNHLLANKFAHKFINHSDLTDSGHSSTHFNTDNLKNTNSDIYLLDKGDNIYRRNNLSLLPIDNGNILYLISMSINTDADLERVANNMEISFKDIISKKENYLSPWHLDFNVGTNISNISSSQEYSTNKLGGQFSMYLEHQWQGGFVIGGGIQYQNIRFQSTTQFTDSIQIFKPNAVDTIYQYGEGLEFFSYKDSVSGLGITDFGHTNQLITYSIPLFIGHDWKKGKFNYGARVGINLLLRKQIVGRILSDARTIVAVDELTTGLDLGYYLRAQIGYDLTDRWTIWTHITQSRTSIFLNPELQAQNVASSIGSTIGLRYRIN